MHQIPVTRGSCLLFAVFASAITWDWNTPVDGVGLTQPTAQLVQHHGTAPSPFDLSQASVPENEIRSGGPAKDGIPALSNPKFVGATDADFMEDDDRVIGLVSNNEARAYPLAILNYHEIVNDRIGELPIAVTYCPLCDSAAVFDRRTPLGEREFGVSGLLYNSNVLIYDREGKTQSLWSQLKAEGISGPAVGQALTSLPFELTTWKNWVTRYPDTQVLDDETGHPRNYRRNPYSNYFSSPKLMFPVALKSDAMPIKTPVLGVWTDRAARVYKTEMFSADRRRISDQLDGKKFTIEYNPNSRNLRVLDQDPGIRWMYSLWFAWYAFHPDTEVFGVPQP
ncbi:hypothetical protein CA13_03110 [Planctomycetes bacterium CA13]|uniref:DUF3179 domain-containing protein n=2 Tax=Novipirellula herctigrandis TaxID=2527986 RepID=A0A5C5YV67_9BACT|nr:hypothetical protein CA13_03110 [Planctomycetes bacterium CA13]